MCHLNDTHTHTTHTWVISASGEMKEARSGEQKEGSRREQEEGDAIQVAYRAACAGISAPQGGSRQHMRRLPLHRVSASYSMGAAATFIAARCLREKGHHQRGARMAARLPHLWLLPIIHDTALGAIAIFSLASASRSGIVA